MRSEENGVLHHEIVNFERCAQLNCAAATAADSCERESPAQGKNSNTGCGNDDEDSGDTVLFFYKY